MDRAGIDFGESFWPDANSRTRILELLHHDLSRHCGPVDGTVVLVSAGRTERARERAGRLSWRLDVATVVEHDAVCRAGVVAAVAVRAGARPIPRHRGPRGDRNRAGIERLVGKVHGVGHPAAGICGASRVRIRRSGGTASSTATAARRGHHQADRDQPPISH